MAQLAHARHAGPASSCSGRGERAANISVDILQRVDDAGDVIEHRELAAAVEMGERVTSVPFSRRFRDLAALGPAASAATLARSAWARTCKACARTTRAASRRLRRAPRRRRSARPRDAAVGAQRGCCGGGNLHMARAPRRPRRPAPTPGGARCAVRGHAGVALRADDLKQLRPARAWARPRRRACGNRAPVAASASPWRRIQPGPGRRGARAARWRRARAQVVLPPSGAPPPPRPRAPRWTATKIRRRAADGDPRGRRRPRARGGFNARLANNFADDAALDGVALVEQGQDERRRPPRARRPEDGATPSGDGSEPATSRAAPSSASRPSAACAEINRELGYPGRHRAGAGMGDVASMAC